MAVRHRVTNLVDAAGTTLYSYAVGGQLWTEDVQAADGGGVLGVDGVGKNFHSPFPLPFRRGEGNREAG